MKTKRCYKIVILAGCLGGLATLTSCGGTLAEQVFNTNFLFQSGLETGGAQQQVAPVLPQFLLVKITNQTNYPASVLVRIKRAQGSEDFAPPYIAPTQTIGHLVETCDSTSNPVLSLFVPLLQDIGGSSEVPIPLGQAFVTVDGLPVLIPASELPGTLNNRVHFNCGDTVEFVITTSFTDVNRFRISALVYSGTP
jgi:hypothetical protein